tara:strand:+ start:4015 stop:4437 length:423 start_codon:yes stop_codon:yes gene_type:complete
MLDVDKLLGALDNESNESVVDLNWKDVHALKNDMLQKLHLSRDALRSMHRKLKAYRYVDELPDLRFGAYVRWIPLEGDNAGKLLCGGIVCDVKTDDGVAIVCRNRQHRFFQARLGECLMFQKLSDQEMVILSALDYLQDK